MSDHTLDGIRIALAGAFTAGMFACAAHAALLINGGQHRHRRPTLQTVRWIYRLVGFLSLLAALGFIARV